MRLARRKQPTRQSGSHQITYRSTEVQTGTATTNSHYQFLSNETAVRQMAAGKDNPEIPILAARSVKMGE
ncbi:hypothetical protein Tph_c21220 [Thermacetogenium phaeum DSM 12270]|uniref:Uncharacterized protein n=1 Tax=Thermacetogenium phaeum (strain ATCC BAA-254 / DSM 26808 / PB) TaxID=1089553 RepID=K4LH59_THEPS|nr:hypothetical protein [Thermacetogenium phaeum]AFV12316.1 hypothetical protein Tph_c21220 [Thermacetogenium phaeum DSM 12270]